ncbi:neither inactivation nor afterpotential protein G [Scaptodrosophila lebanonensis]|uniref:Neither inactivation nor afterpotential protein G n=1 Tax=Drosophila lebanonensis TaxID=7225 RepID=A0A6J2THT4_DROLE|nr:neither inactivation nor afterpotential protein G [Scaptodrosophila lebanonensis]
MKFRKILIFGAIAFGLLAALLVLLSSLLSESLPNVLAPEGRDYVFDYVIVGAGTGGSVLTSLLAKHSNGSVLLIEAGGAFGLLSRIPLLTTFQQKGINDWSFLSVPQKHSSRGLIEQRQCLPRGKGLGGSANLNYMLHFDGHAPDFEAWHKRHNLSDWSWEQIRPFLAAAKPQTLFEIPRSYSKLTQALDEAEAQFPHKSWHFRRSRYCIRNGLRHSVLQQFLQPVMKNVNLRLLPQALVKRIKLSKSPKLRATSVLVGIKDEHTNKEHEFSIKVQRELILCAGAYQTPQLLLASGIGDRSTLAKLQLPVQHHLPLVGQGLHDHFNMPLFVSTGVIGPSLNQRTLLDPFNLLNYLSSGTGHFGNFGVVGHVSGHEEVEWPFSVTFFGAGAIDEGSLMSISNFKRAAFRALFPRYHNSSQEGFVAISNCLQPKSRGSVTLLNSSMRRNPLIDPNFLSSSEDLNCTIDAMRHAIQLITSPAFASLQPRIHWPRLRECANFGPFERDFFEHSPSDHYLECIIRHLGLSSHHPGGSCAMGSTSNDSVVDAQLRLHGINNLRIVDASVLPSPISGNPNTIIAAIAVRAATWILKSELQEGQVSLGL